MKILAVETSCDDTCIAIVEARKNGGDFKILSNVVSSQVKVHKKWGGVVPSLAKREHQKNLVPVLEKALEEAKMLKKSKFQNPNYTKSNPKSKCQTLKRILEREDVLFGKLEKFLGQYEKPAVDVIAVTYGPGLAPALWVGVNFAKALSYIWEKPIIPVDHLEGHLLANLLPQIGGISNFPSFAKATEGRQNPKIINFPALCLIVSGGHTQLVLMRKIGKYKIIGETLDDAAGEAFDKVAKMLSLGFPGGPVIAAQAAKLKTTNYKLKTKLPRPMMHTKDYNFSFSGLKTAVLYKIKELKTTNYKLKTELCAEFQQAVVDVLIHKTLRAAKEYRARTIMLAGGVAANEELRKQLAESVKKQLPDILYLTPDISLATDNAVMIAAAGYFRYKNNPSAAMKWPRPKANANLRMG